MTRTSRTSVVNAADVPVHVVVAVEDHDNVRVNVDARGELGATTCRRRRYSDDVNAGVDLDLDLDLDVDDDTTTWTGMICSR